MNCKTKYKKYKTKYKNLKKINMSGGVWGIASKKQEIEEFELEIKEPQVLEIGPGKGLLLDKIIDIYGKSNV